MFFFFLEWSRRRRRRIFFFFSLSIFLSQKTKRISILSLSFAIESIPLSFLFL